jgi:acyl-CoA thioester hydrolase
MTDIDTLNHVNNGIFASYYDLGRLHYMKTVLGDFSLAEIDLVLVHTEYNFMNSVRFEDHIAVETKVTSLGKRSVKMLQRIIDAQNGQIKNTCYSVLSGYDKSGNCSKEIEKQFVEAVTRYEEQ